MPATAEAHRVTVGACCGVDGPVARAGTRPTRVLTPTGRAPTRGGSHRSDRTRPHPDNIPRPGATPLPSDQQRKRSGQRRATHHHPPPCPLFLFPAAVPRPETAPQGALVVRSFITQITIPDDVRHHHPACPSTPSLRRRVNSLSEPSYSRVDWRFDGCSGFGGSVAAGARLARLASKPSMVSCLMVSSSSMRTRPSLR